MAEDNATNTEFGEPAWPDYPHWLQHDWMIICCNEVIDQIQSLMTKGDEFWGFFEFCYTFKQEMCLNPLHIQPTVTGTGSGYAGKL